MEEEKVSKKRILMTLIVFGIVLVLDFFVKETHLEFFEDQIAVTVIRGLLFAIGLIDVWFSIREILEVLINRMLCRVRTNVKDNVESKICSCAGEQGYDYKSLKSTDIIKNIIYAYPDWGEEQTKKVCENLKNQYYKNSNMRDEISYFFITNANYDSIKKYIEDNNDFFEECQNHSQHLTEEFLKTKDWLEESLHEEFQYKKMIIQLVHVSLKIDLTNNDVLDAMRTFFSWFREQNKKSFRDLSQEQIALLLQTVSKIENQIKGSADVNKHKEIKKFCKKAKRIVNSTKVKRIVNSMCGEICKMNAHKEDKPILIDDYARKTGVITGLFYHVSLFNRIRLSLSLYIENKRFNDLYHKITRTTAICMLLGAESLTAYYNPDERFGEKMASLVISLANLAF